MIMQNTETRRLNEGNKDDDNEDDEKDDGDEEQKHKQRRRRTGWAGYLAFCIYISAYKIIQERVDS